MRKWFDAENEFLAASFDLEAQSNSLLRRQAPPDHLSSRPARALHRAVSKDHRSVSVSRSPPPIEVALKSLTFEIRLSFGSDFCFSFGSDLTDIIYLDRVIGFRL
ncbi:hypothetical protein L1887_18064 [Cichorium endivia]|nr:hypothetical protein L1887_18064 [Cichorium endivia]